MIVCRVARRGWDHLGSRLRSETRRRGSTRKRWRVAYEGAYVDYGAGHVPRDG